jgi:hypothetical protein
LDKARSGPTVGRGSTPRRIEDLSREIQCDIVSAQVELEDVSLRKLPGRPDAPPNATIRIRWLTVEGELRETRWLLAESWWAESFDPPTFGELCKWALVIVPWTIISHYGRTVRRANRALADARSTGGSTARWLPLLAAIPLLIISPFIILPVSFSLIALSLLALVPRVRRYVGLAQKLVSSTIGDSFVLVQKPLPSASIVSKVRRDLDWVMSRCEKPVAVAHSQGGAVAQLMLRSSVPLQFRVLLTFGSGLRKLEELRTATTNQSVAGFMAVIGALIVISALSPFPASPIWLRIVAGTVGVVPLIAGLMFATTEFVDEELARWTGLLSEASVTWEDYYASSDPVPNGPLFDADNPLLSVEVANRGSFVSDHNAYWTNMDEFVSTVVQAVAGATDPLPKVSDLDEDTLQRAPHLRAWRVLWLRAARGAAWLLTAVSLISKWSWLPWVGETALNGLDGTVRSWLGVEVSSTLMSTLRNPTAETAIGALIWGGVALALYRFVAIGWDTWDAAEIRRFFRRDIGGAPSTSNPGPGRRRAAHMTFLVFAAAASAATLIGLTACCPVMPTLMWFRSRGLTLLFIVLVAVLTAVAGVVERRFRPQAPPSGRGQLDHLYQRLPAYSLPTRSRGVVATSDEARALKALESLRKEPPDGE